MDGQGNHVYQSDLYGDDVDITSAFGNDFSMNGMFVDEVEENPEDCDDSTRIHVGAWPPNLNQWKDEKAHYTHPRVTFNGSSDFSYGQAKKEVAYFVDRLGHGKEGIKNLFDKCFGMKSELFLKCHEHLDMSYDDDFCCFLATFLLSVNSARRTVDCAVTNTLTVD